MGSGEGGVSEIEWLMKEQREGNDLVKEEGANRGRTSHRDGGP